eukprot:COSAG01_NODE_16286_length_1243_cov_4.476977_1_plen_80_part_00
MIYVGYDSVWPYTIIQYWYIYHLHRPSVYVDNAVMAAHNGLAARQPIFFTLNTSHIGMLIEHYYQGLEMYIASHYYNPT